MVFVTTARFSAAILGMRIVQAVATQARPVGHALPGIQTVMAFVTTARLGAAILGVRTVLAVVAQARPVSVNHGIQIVMASVILANHVFLNLAACRGIQTVIAFVTTARLGAAILGVRTVLAVVTQGTPVPVKHGPRGTRIVMVFVTGTKLIASAPLVHPPAALVIPVSVSSGILIAIVYVTLVKTARRVVAPVIPAPRVSVVIMYQSLYH